MLLNQELCIFQAQNLVKFLDCFYKNFNTLTSLRVILLKKLVYKKISPSQAVQFQRFYDISLYRIIHTILFFLHFDYGLLWGFGKEIFTEKYDL